MPSDPKKCKFDLSKIDNQRWFLAGLTLVIGIAFILIGNLQNKPGFPLDDAWIHQTYARNLAQTGQWEYIPGQESAGSTSPLWTMLLSIGFLLGFKTPFLWTSALSNGMLIGIALVINEILQHFYSEKPWIGMAGCLITVLDWHLLWSAASGMETLFFCLASIYVFWILICRKYWLWLGAVCGLIVWIRPDGITLLGPVVFIIFIQLLTKKFRVRDALAFAVPLLLLLVLYGLFNYSISGKVFPNTFYAKQVEYAKVLAMPLLTRLEMVFLVPLSGAGVLLAPGFIFGIFNAVRKRNWWMMTAILWFIGYGAIYALKLPMTYQHGRYLFPLIPVFFMIGLIGTADLLLLIKDRTKLRNYSMLAGLTVAVVCLMFIVSGESALIKDINTINVFMVQPAEWVRENTAPDALIAVHDIGAMGFFGERKMIDLAGLIQPELIPIISNEAKIKQYLIQSKADYLVVMRDWYPSLNDFGKEVARFNLEVNSKSYETDIKELR